MTGDTGTIFLAKNPGKELQMQLSYFSELEGLAAVIVLK